MSQPVRVGIEGVFYSLTHVPDLVRYGSKPLRELRASPGLNERLANQLRDFAAATAYPPHQVYIGNLAPEKLGNLPKPWYEKLIEGATTQGRFGELIDQIRFYALLAGADQFDLVRFEEKWFHEYAALFSHGRAPRLCSPAEIKARCAAGALALHAGARLVGAFDSGHAEDANLAPEVLLENLSAKVTAAHSLRAVLTGLGSDLGEVDYVISCSEEAVGDRYNRGGGNLAKAIAEDAGCVSILRRADVCDGTRREFGSVRHRTESSRGCWRIARQAGHEIRIPSQK
jgi:hypothetical protein